MRNTFNTYHNWKLKFLFFAYIIAFFPVFSSHFPTAIAYLITDKNLRIFRKLNQKIKIKKKRKNEMYDLKSFLIISRF